MKAARLHGPRDLRCEDGSAPRTAARRAGCGSPSRPWACAAATCTPTSTAASATRRSRARWCSGTSSPGWSKKSAKRRSRRRSTSANRGAGGGRSGLALRTVRALPNGGIPTCASITTFAGVYPTDGAMRQSMHAPASACFVVPETVTAEDAAMLEPLGVGCTRSISGTSASVTACSWSGPVRSGCSSRSAPGWRERGPCWSATVCHTDWNSLERGGAETDPHRANGPRARDP